MIATHELSRTAIISRKMITAKYGTHATAPSRWTCVFHFPFAVSHFVRNLRCCACSVCRYVVRELRRPLILSSSPPTLRQTRTDEGSAVACHRVSIATLIGRVSQPAYSDMPQIYFFVALPRRRRGNTFGRSTIGNTKSNGTPCVVRRFYLQGGAPSTLHLARSGSKDDCDHCTRARNEQLATPAHRFPRYVTNQGRGRLFCDAWICNRRTCSRCCS